MSQVSHRLARPHLFVPQIIEVLDWVFSQINVHVMSSTTETLYHKFYPKICKPRMQKKKIVKLELFIFVTGDFVHVVDDINGALIADNSEDQASEPSAMEKYANQKFIEYHGTDPQKQNILVIYACRLPAKKDLNDIPFIEYMNAQMEPYVQSDYVIVYFHQGLQQDNKPSFSFLLNSSLDLERNFRKRLKKLYVVHPTLSYRLIWNFLKPFISEKFENKIIHISNLNDLRLSLGQLKLPEISYELDEKNVQRSECRRC